MSMDPHRRTLSDTTIKVAAVKSAITGSSEELSNALAQMRQASEQLAASSRDLKRVVRDSGVMPVVRPPVRK